MNYLRCAAVTWIVLLATVVTNMSLAATMVFPNRDDFRAAAGVLTLQEFNGDFTTDNTNPNPLSFDGFNVAETGGTPNLHKFSFGGSEFLHFQSDDPSTVVFTFDKPIRAFGLTTVDFAREIDLQEGLTETITYLDNSPGASAVTVVSRTSGGSTGVLNFFGVVNDTPFNEVTLMFSTGATSQVPFNGDDVGLENLEFAVVPLPGAFVLLVTGILGLGAFARRQGR